jgi:hypothetical protein
MGAIQPQLKQQAFHRTCRTMLSEELRDRRHRAVCWAYRCLLRPLFTLWIQSAQARMPVFEFLDS